MTRSRDNADIHDGSTGITTLGTVATGTWQGTTVAVNQGGTGAATHTANNVMIGAGTSALTSIAPGADGQVLTSTGSAWNSEAAAGGGITHASEWHLTSNLTGDAPPITGSLAALGGSIGGAMTHSSGLFTFPDEGIWEIRCSWMFYIATSTDRSCGIAIEVEKGSGAGYAEVAFGANGISNTGSGTQFSHAGCQYLFDVINKDTYKVRFSVDVVNTGVISYGSGTSARCAITFVRLGDT